MSHPAIELRSALVSESACIAHMHSQSWKATYRGLLPDAFLDLEVDQDRIAHWQNKMPQLHDGLGQVMFAEVDGNIAGFICVLRPDQSNSVLIDNLHARAGYQGIGIGTRLLEFAHVWAVEQGATQMHLYVLDGNIRAGKFYASRGWIKVGEEPDNLSGIDIVSLRYALPVTAARSS